MERPTLDDRDCNWEGFMVGPIPPFFVGQICTGHRAGWTRNPLGDEHIWLCGECMRPSRVALLCCLGCEQWYYETLIEYNRSDGRRNDYFCEECR